MLSKDNTLTANVESNGMYKLCVFINLYILKENEKSKGPSATHNEMHRFETPRQRSKEKRFSNKNLECEASKG